MAQLLASKADINQTDHHGNTALFRAARTGRAEPVRLLISAAADVNKANTTTKAGVTPLMVAASESHGNIVGLLVSAGARRGSYRELLAAVKMGVVEDVVRLVDTAGVDVNRTTEATATGWTLLMEASGRGHEQVVRRLLASRAGT